MHQRVKESFQKKQNDHLFPLSQPSTGSTFSTKHSDIDDGPIMNIKIMEPNMSPYISTQKSYELPSKTMISEKFAKEQEAPVAQLGLSTTSLVSTVWKKIRQSKNSKPLIDKYNQHQVTKQQPLTSRTINHGGSSDTLHRDSSKSPIKLMKKPSMSNLKQSNHKNTTTKDYYSNMSKVYESTQITDITQQPIIQSGRSRNQCQKLNTIQSVAQIPYQNSLFKTTSHLNCSQNQNNKTHQRPDQPITLDQHQVMCSTRSKFIPTTRSQSQLKITHSIERSKSKNESTDKRMSSGGKTNIIRFASRSNSQMAYHSATDSILNQRYSSNKKPRENCSPSKYVNKIAFNKKASTVSLNDKYLDSLSSIMDQSLQEMSKMISVKKKRKEQIDKEQQLQRQLDLDFQNVLQYQKQLSNEIEQQKRSMIYQVEQNASIQQEIQMVNDLIIAKKSQIDSDVAKVKFQKLEAQEHFEDVACKIEKEIMSIKQQYLSQKVEIEELEVSNRNVEEFLEQMRNEIHRKQDIEDMRVSSIKDKVKLLMNLIKQEEINGRNEQNNQPLNTFPRQSNSQIKEVVAYLDLSKVIEEECSNITSQRDSFSPQKRL